MGRIVIIGNSGSGKSYLAQRLSDYYGYPVIHLDALFWEPGGFNVKRPKEIVYAEIVTLVHGENWIVEGVFGELAQAFFANAEQLIWLDLDQETCMHSLLQRGSESSKQLYQQSAEENFQKLLTWASAYWQREDLRSHRGHANLFTQFNGKKDSFQTRLAVNDFLDSLQPRLKNSMNEQASLANITFTENGPVDVTQLNALYRLIGWDRHNRRSKAETTEMLRLSHYYIAAHTDEGSLVGFARVCGDPYVAQVLDVITHPAYRRRGIATACMRGVLAHLQRVRYVSVTLTDGSGIDGFYQRFGFQECKDSALVWKP